MIKTVKFNVIPPNVPSSRGDKNNFSYSKTNINNNYLKYNNTKEK